ncbi:MAG: hypothetical protein KDA32_04655 [Phycisphaerales bacterium]|nr:hypothetical protein [Phycisphaerales bacterium]
MAIRQLLMSISVIAAATGLAGCESKPKDGAAASGQNMDFLDTEEDADARLMNSLGYVNKDADEGNQPKHTHTAPHQGALFQLGDHFANIELTLAPGEGLVTLYALDAHAENAVRLSHESLELTVTTIDGAKRAEPLVLTLAPYENALTGEKPGDSSEFRASSADLTSAKQFSGVLKMVTIKGETYNDLPVHWPAK